MANLFLRVLAVSMAVSLLLLPLLLCRRWLESRYAPQTRRWLWLSVGLVLLAAPWLPKPHAPVVVEAPVYELSLPAASGAEPVTPVQPIPPAENQPLLPAQSGTQSATPPQDLPQTTLPAASQHSPPRRSTLSLTALAAGVWLGGAALVLLWQGGRYLLIRRRLLRHSRPVTGLARYAAELGLEGKVTFYLCQAVPGPMTLGLFRPLVLLPAGEVAPAALRHELYHIKRRDVGYKTLLLLSCALHWFNPLCWLMLRAADRDVEACCDAEVVAGRDNGYKRSYGELLLSAAETPTLPFTTRFGGSGKQMKTRLTQLFRPGKRSRPLICAVLALAVALGSLVACKQAAPTPPEEGEETPKVEAEAKPLTERTMPTLVYYDPERDFLLYHTLDTAYLHYGDSYEEFCPDQSAGRRVLWRCDVSRDEQTVYLSHVFDDSENRDERFYAWDIAARTLTEVDSIPPGEDHTTHVGGEELYNSGFVGATDLRSNALKTADGAIVALTIDSHLGDGSLPYLCFSRLDGEGVHTKFLTPEKIPAPKDYTDPDWGFTLHLPESLEGQYYVRKGGNAWLFYDKAQFGGNGGFLLGLWAVDAQTPRTAENPDPILGEKGGIRYTLSTWPMDDMEGVPPERQESYQAMLSDVAWMRKEALDLSQVTRSGGYLWPIPDTRAGESVILRGFEAGHEHIDILASDNYLAWSMAAGRVTRIHQNRNTGLYEVTVAHDDILSSLYGNLSELVVSEGDEVRLGDALGSVGVENDRRLLRFAIEVDGSYRDPLEREYRLWDFSPLTKDDLLIAGDPQITAALRDARQGGRAFYDVETGEAHYSNLLPDSDGVSVKVYRFAELDMDNDTVPEVVLWLQRGDDQYQLGSIVLRYQGGEVWGYPVGYRSMLLETLKADGTFAWNSSAFEGGYARMSFRSGEPEPVEEDASQQGKPNVVWYEPDGSCVFDLRVEESRTLTVKLINREPMLDYFPVEEIRVYEGRELLQTLRTAELPQPQEYAWDGCFVNRGYAVGEPVVKDLNFDGSQDFGVLAVSGYPHNVPYNYFLWNREKNCFEYAFTRFSELKPDPARKELVETEYSTTGDIINRYTYTPDGTLQKQW